MWQQLCNAQRAASPAVMIDKPRDHWSMERQEGGGEGFRRNALSFIRNDHYFKLCARVCPQAQRGLLARTHTHKSKGAHTHWIGSFASHLSEIDVKTLSIAAWWIVGWATHRVDDFISCTDRGRCDQESERERREKEAKLAMNEEEVKKKKPTLIGSYAKKKGQTAMQKKKQKYYFQKQLKKSWKKS